jgi:hypothetical protein
MQWLTCPEQKHLQQNTPKQAYYSNMIEEHSLATHFQHLKANCRGAPESSVAIKKLAHLRSITAPHAGSWLNAVPIKNSAAEMPPAIFPEAIKLWAGIPLFRPSLSSHLSTPCPRCRKSFPPSVDVFGDHILSCKHGSFLNNRHNAIRDELINQCARGQMRPRFEPTNLIPDTILRPADVFIPHLFEGKDTCIDVAVTSCLQPKFVLKAGLTTAAAPNLYQSTKITRYQETCRRHNLHFAPLIMDQYGAMGDVGSVLVQKIARQIATTTNTPYSTVAYRLHQRLRCTLMSRNATEIANTRSRLQPEQPQLQAQVPPHNPQSQQLQSASIVRQPIVVPQHSQHLQHARRPLLAVRRAPQQSQQPLVVERHSPTNQPSQPQQIQRALTPRPAQMLPVFHNAAPINTQRPTVQCPQQPLSSPSNPSSLSSPSSSSSPSYTSDSSSFSSTDDLSSLSMDDLSSLPLDFFL